MNQDRPDLDADRKGVRRIARVDPEQPLSDEQMPGRADWQILGESLDKSEDEGLEIVHPAETEPILDRALSGFLGADADRVFDRKDEDFSITDLAGGSRRLDGINNSINLRIVNNNFEADFRNKIDLVFGSTVGLCVSTLTPETSNFTNSDSLNSSSL